MNIKSIKISIQILLLCIFTLPLFADSESVPYEFINYLFPQHQEYDNKVIVVEKSTQKAYLYQIKNNPLSLSLEKQFSVTTGQKNGDKEKKGDLKTPEGFYLIEGEIPKGRLTSKYGFGAFPLNYPNSIDQYLKKKGNGIWLHGTDRAITPYDTEGCVRFDNKDLAELSKKFDFGKTTVIINDQINWVEIEKLNEDIAEINSILTQWEEAWESQDLTSYLQFYHTEFYTENLKLNFERWAKYKERINAKRKEIQVKLSNVKYFYSKGYLLVEFNQEYKAHNYSDVGKKSMLWKKEDKDWMILREEWDGHAVPVKSNLKIDFDHQLPESSDALNQSVKQ